MTWSRLPFFTALACAACTTTPGTSLEPRTQALLDVKAYIGDQLGQLDAASTALCAAAPVADADGWNAHDDPAAVTAMKAQWKLARTAYEHIEGAIAVLFPDLDISTDQRYDGFIAVATDSDLFDDVGVTGIHGIERILWSDEIPPQVTLFEVALPGYVTPSFPTNAAQAEAFKTKLCARLVTDVRTMSTQFSTLALDPAAAYRGVIGSMAEQVEKADRAAGGEEESRYANYTLADMRTNVDAGLSLYKLFEPWLLTTSGGAAVDAQILAGFARVQAAYAKLPGDGLPAVPSTWYPPQPSAQDLATPFGQLWTVLQAEADAKQTTSLVSAMTASAALMGIPELP